MKELKEKSFKAFFERALKDARLIICLIIYLCINLALLALPFVNSLSYEFIAINSIILFSLIAIYSLPNEYRFHNTFYNIIISIFFLSIPLLIILVKTIFTGICSFEDTIKFYFLILVPVPVISLAIVEFIRSVFRNFHKTIFFMIFLIIIILNLIEYFYRPQVFIFNPIICFFNGNMYDEYIKISFKVLAYRIINLIYFAVLYYLSTSVKISKIKLTSIFVSTALVFFLISPYLGYSRTDSSLDTYLDKSSSEHFNYFISKNLPAKRIEFLKKLHEFYYKRLSEYLNITLTEKISSYIFVDNDEKAILFGAGQADMAKPWMNSIFISAETYDYTLMHELAHAFSAQLNNNLLKMPFNYGLIEGFASALSDYSNKSSLLYQAELAYANGYRADVTSLFRTGFFSSNSSLSYVYTGAFIKFLIDKYGIDKIKKLYESNSFSETYAKKMDLLADEFNKYLDQNRVINKSKADMLFGYPALFQKVCMHYAAKLQEKATDYFVSGEYVEAEEVFSKLNVLTNNYNSLYGLTESYFKQKKVKQALNLLADKQYKFINTSYYPSIILEMNKAFILNNQKDKGDSVLNELVKMNGSINSKISANLFLNLNAEYLSYKYFNETKESRLRILKEYYYASKDIYAIPFLINSETKDYIEFQFTPEKLDDTSLYIALLIFQYGLENNDYGTCAVMLNLVKDENNNQYAAMMKELFNPMLDYFIKNRISCFNHK